MADPARSTLPLPDYDHLPIGSLESRVRSLSADEVEQLLAYERSRADRLPVIRVLDSRLEQLQGGAEPTSGDPNALRPEAGAGGRGGSPVSPATSPQPHSPPPHGTPDQPAQPKGDRT